MRDMVNRIIVGVLTINGYSTPLASVRTFADLISDAPVFFTLLNAGSIQGAYWRIVHEVGVYVNPCLQELTHGYTHVQKCAGGVMLSNESPLDGGTYEKYTDDQR